METRSTRSTVTFRKPFLLPGSIGPLPEGDYVLLIEEERLQGLTFDAYRRTSSFLVVENDPAFRGQIQMVPLSETDLAKVVERDRAGQDNPPPHDQSTLLTQRE